MKSNREDCIFSVVIIAYDRRDFILQAIDSVLRQSISSSKYEIIVVKNYTDRDIDGKIAELKINNITTTEISLGEKLIMGSIQAKGEYVCILEDDDQFVQDKLETVQKYIDEDVAYIHHCRELVNSKGQISQPERYRSDEFNHLEFRNPSLLNFYKMRKLGIDFNNSSIVIRRAMILKHKDLIRKLTFHLDHFLFLLAISSRNRIVEIDSPLTLYRVHDYALDNSTSFVEFKHSRLKRLERLLEETVAVYESMQYKIPKIFMLCDNLRMKSMIRLLGSESPETKITLDEVIYGFFPKPPIKTYIYDIQLYLGTKVHKNLRRKLITRAFGKAVEKVGEEL